MVAVSGCFKWSERGRKILAVDFWIPVPFKLTTEGIQVERLIASVMPRFTSE